MHDHTTMTADSKPDFYRKLANALRTLLAGERDWLANLANSAALLAQNLADNNWVGFYLFRDDQLVLGPFIGKPACVRVAIGRGVCGTAAASRKPVLVPDVHVFPGHITCDEASRSELVIPLLLADRLLGVLDLDSPKLARFTEEDQVGLSACCGVLVAATDWP